MKRILSVAQWNRLDPDRRPPRQNRTIPERVQPGMVLAEVGGARLVEGRLAAYDRHDWNREANR